MAQTPLVPIDILDRPRSLRFDINAISDLEMKANVGIGTLMSDERIGFNAIRLLLWAGLKWEDRRMSPEQAGTLMQEHLEGGGGLRDIMTPIELAINKSGLLSDPDGEGASGNGQAAALEASPSQPSTSG